MTTKNPSLVVHSTWDESRNDEFPDVLIYRKKWEDLGFTVKVTPNDEIRRDVERLAERFPSHNFLQKFDNLETNNMRFDFWRYAKLYLEGGVYADVDVEPLEAMKRWTDTAARRDSAVFFQETNFPDAPFWRIWVLMFTNFPDNPAYATCVVVAPGPEDAMFVDILSQMNPSKFTYMPEPRRTLRSVGPGHVTEYIKVNFDSEKIILASHEEQEQAYHHHGFGTWKPGPVKDRLWLGFLYLTIFAIIYVVQKKTRNACRQRYPCLKGEKSKC